MISRQSVIDVLEERQNFYAERNMCKQMFAIAGAIGDVLALPSENPWHTGTPTKDDWYFVLWRDTDDDWRRFSALLWNNHNKVWYDDVTPDTNWGDEYHAEVIAWMPIPDFKEKEDG